MSQKAYMGLGGEEEEEVDQEEVLVQALLDCALLPPIPWEPAGQRVEEGGGGGDQRQGVDSEGD